MLLPPGLTYQRNVLTLQEQDLLSQFCSEQEWDTVLSRKTLLYGYRYDYRTRDVVQTLEIPRFMLDMFSKHLKLPTPTQVIVNYYEPGEGIGAHTDDVNKFGDTIVIFSLLAPIMMHFSSVGYRNPQEAFDVLLEPGSCVVMSGESRYQWKHEIKQRLYDIINGEQVRRAPRMSVTFRYVKTELPTRRRLF